jgi:hypothetical protein
MANVRNLEAFVAFMKTFDRWHKLETIESVIAEKDREIDRLNARLAGLEAEKKPAFTILPKRLISPKAVSLLSWI